DGLRERGVIPESVRQGVEDHQPCIDSGVQVGAVQVDGTGEEQIAAAGDKQRRRQPMQVREDRREHWVPRVGGSYIFRVMRLWLRRIEMPREASQSIDRYRVASAGEVAHAAENAESSGKRQAELL